MNGSILAKLGTRGLIGLLCVWIVAMAFTQHGVAGAIRAVLLELLAVFAFGAWKRLGARLHEIAKWIAVPAILALWIWLAGSYSLTRDLSMIALATALAIATFEETRPVFLCSARREGPRRSIRGGARFQLTWLLLAWLLVSLSDRNFENGAVERQGNMVASAAMPPEWFDLHVGLALSGGGYRAAIVHAGVISELATLGVPVTHLSSVSGGSIIASYVSAGGDPRKFVTAITDGRFRFTRDLTWTWNALSLLAPLHIPVVDVDLLPFSGSTRAGVQADLIDRVLLDGMRAIDTTSTSGPKLIINATDLRYGLSVGFMRSGLLLLGPVAVNMAMQAHLAIPTTATDLPAAFYRYGETIPADILPRLSQRVAISGSFPGAFAPTEIRLSVPKPYRPKEQRSELALSLADGGVRDNLGVNSLLVADILSRFPNVQSSNGLWVRDNLQEDWKLDLIIASDGGQSPQSPEKISTLESIFRAIDLAGLETGAARAFPNGSPPKIELLSTISTFSFTPDQIVSGVSPDDLRDSPAKFFGNGSIDLPSLAYMAKLIPDQESTRPLIERFEAARQEWEKQSEPIPLNCAEQSNTPAARLGCARAALVEAIGADIWRTLQTFRGAATLNDNYSVEAARDLYRFGQYLLRFHWTRIKAELSAAADAKHSASGNNGSPTAPPRE
jgi:predicted acylesterase/phospholipase RssA